MKITKRLSTSLIIILLFIGCTKTIDSEDLDNNKITMDLTTPPPGSNATQEKWDSFDNQKRQDSWNKYILENTPGDNVAAIEDIDETPVRGSGGGAGGSSTVAVIVGELTKAPINVNYYGLGELIAGEEIKVNLSSSGTVQGLYVTEGDFVEVGDLLYSLDSSDVIKDIERSSDKWDNELELAGIKLSEVQEIYETNSSLFAKELISKSEFDKAKQALKESELNFEKIKLAKTSEIENLQKSLETTLAISPSRGYISDITFNKNEFITSSDFIEIINIEKVEAIIQVPENIITRVKLGLNVVAKKASANDYILNGVITSIGFKSNSNRTYSITAEFDNPNQKLLPGMLMETEIELLQLTSNFIVPKASIITEGENHFIYLIENSIAKKVPVELGRSRDSLIQINGKISSGDIFVLVGQTYLQKDSAVNIIEKKTYLPESKTF
ncbi:efflux RND transporter periplasmic adaptor subunit [Thiospirochaeta perfilievii]|uniref:Efflux RND transporter periplasmic adaptor subunit n=1 Tax=Thiospirochaeta perfilievii TaxID=252967 RepID=A0A5C1Q910_9SPIO|nr:efflux RND transporter periplasmic adaptor subunit [Thiospirochaeta perfilievii]QEN03389.1 efflux RND transporter periplasmic adaptor subunit [Thiospirochaeta perfilievii]